MASRPRLYVDVTMSAEEAGRIAHGTLRVERGLVRALASLNRPDIVFCRHHRAGNRFVRVPTDEAMRIVTAPTVSERRREAASPWRSHSALRAGRVAERWFRKRVRDPIADLFRRGRPAAAEHSIFEPGSLLLLCGELQRQDFRLLMALRRSSDLRLAFVFYDLLGTLAPDDPRRADADSFDLPSTDFMVREGALLLAISRYSAGVLQTHVAGLGGRSPPIKVFRLGHDVAPPARADAAPPHLSPGDFVLAVGDVTARKNQAMLAEVWRQLPQRIGSMPIPLIIAGRINRDDADLARTIQAASPQVRILPNADDETLAWLYANCRFTVFASLAEGYGLPVSESLAFGKVCIASSTTAVPEASQGLGIHLDPTDPQAWEEWVARLLTADAELAARQAEIRRRYQLVTWSDSASDVLAAIDALGGCAPT
jgi:glycosyltransferase involved in cell wall biosynthesis